MASKNTPVAIISGAGWLMQLALGLVKGLLSRGWDNERIHALVTDKGKADMERVIDALVNALAAPLVELADFFTTRPGLWVSSEFTNWILTPALAMGETESAKVGKPFDLPRNMTGSEIHKELGGRHVFENARAFCLHLAGTIQRQWGGVEGNLLNNGYANLFYVRVGTEVFAVGVYWSADVREWGVHAFRLDDGQWYAGNRAFPCN